MVRLVLAVEDRFQNADAVMMEVALVPEGFPLLHPMGGVPPQVTDSRTTPTRHAACACHQNTTGVRARMAGTVGVAWAWAWAVATGTVLGEGLPPGTLQASDPASPQAAVPF